MIPLAKGVAHPTGLVFSSLSFGLSGSSSMKLPHTKKAATLPPFKQQPPESLTAAKLWIPLKVASFQGLKAGDDFY